MDGGSVDRKLLFSRLGAGFQLPFAQRNDEADTKPYELVPGKDVILTDRGRVNGDGLVLEVRGDASCSLVLFWGRQGVFLLSLALAWVDVAARENGSEAEAETDFEVCVAGVVIGGGEGEFLLVGFEGDFVVGFEGFDVFVVRGVRDTRVALGVVPATDVAGVVGVVAVVVGGGGGGGGGRLVRDGDGGVVVWEGAVLVRTRTAGGDDSGLQMDCGNRGGGGGCSDLSGFGGCGGNDDWGNHAEWAGSGVDRGAKNGADAHKGK